MGPGHTQDLKRLVEIMGGRCGEQHLHRGGEGAVSQGGGSGRRAAELHSGYTLQAHFPLETLLICSRSSL